MALAYACRSPELINRLVITNAPPRMDDSCRDAVADVQRRFAETFPNGPGDSLTRTPRTS